MRWEKGAPSDTSKMYLEENRLRSEHDSGVVIIVPDVNQRTALFLNVRQKLYQSSDLPKQIADRITSPIDHFRRAKPDDAEHIGQEQLDGCLADLCRVRDPDFMGIQRRGEMLIWVDPANSLPTKIVIRGGKSEQRFESFRWNQDLDDRLFSLKPPADYAEGHVVGFPDPKAAEKPALPVSPSQLAKGILSDDRIPFRMVWGPKGSTITATTHIRAHCELRLWDDSMKERPSWRSRVCENQIHPHYTEEDQTCCTSQLTSIASS